MVAAGILVHINQYTVFVSSSKMVFHLYDIFLCWFAGINGQDKQFKAYFNMQGVTGNVEFVGTSSSDTTTAVLNIEVKEAWTNWEIREFPVVTTHDFSNCADSLLGDRYIVNSRILRYSDTNVTSYIDTQDKVLTR